MRKGCNEGGRKEEMTDENSGHYVIATSRPPEPITMFIVATNVVASRQPERQPTGMPHNCAKIQV